MPDFDFKGQFPIGGYLDAIQRKALAEEEQKRNQQAQFIGSLTQASQGFANVLEKRRQTAEALAQAQTLSQNPYFQQVLTGQEPIEDRPVAEVAGRPVALSQTAAGDVNAPASPTIKKFSTEQIANLLANPKGLETIFKAKENIDKNAQVEDLVATRDSLGNVIGYQKVSRQKGSRVILPSVVKPTMPGRLSDTQKGFVKVIDKFDADPGVRKQMSSIDAAKTIQELISSNNPIAASAIPTYMARASGEVGNLSEADKRPFGGSQAIKTRLEAALREKATGRLTPENAKFLSELAATMERRANANIDDRANLIAKQYASSYSSTPEEIFKTLRPDSVFATKKESSPKSSNADLATMSDEELRRIAEGK